MGFIEHGVMIDASVEKVFGLLCDTTRFDRWVFGYAGLLEGPEKLTENAQFRWRMKGHGLTLKPRSKIIEFTAPTGYTEEIRIPGIVRGQMKKMVIAEKRRTRLKWSFEYRLIGGPIGTAIDWAIAHRVIERAIYQSLQQAKATLEAEKRPANAQGIYRRQTAVR